MTANPIQAWASRNDRERLLQIVQPALIGLIDGTVSTLAPIFATAFLAGTHAALLVGLAASLGAGISMGLSEALSTTAASAAAATPPPAERSRAAPPSWAAPSTRSRSSS